MNAIREVQNTLREYKFINWNKYEERKKINDKSAVRESA